MSKFSVKWYDDTFPGAPTLNGTPGSLIAVLDAVLVDGFGENNITGINVQDKKATITLSTNAKYIQYSIVSISGLSDIALNGEYRVISSDTGTLVVEMDSVNGPISFTDAKVKIPSMGWYKPFSSVNRAIYKRADDSSSEWYLYIDDQLARAARVKICENATSIDNIIDYKPFSDNSYWNKSSEASANKRAYSVIADNQGFYYRPGLRNTNNSSIGNTYYVGKTINSTNITDNFDIFINYSDSNAGSYRSNIFNITSSNNNFSSNNPKLADFLRTSDGFKINCACITENFILGYDQALSSFSKNSEIYFNDNLSLELKEHLTITDISNRRRYLPGIYDVNNYKASIIDPHVILPVDNSFNKLLMFLQETDSNISSSFSSSRYGVFFDITGPWR